MARLIDEDYFIGDIAIPNLNDESAISALNSNIDKYQEEVLIMMLGYDLYSKFIADPDAEQRFKDIRDGKEFEFSFNGSTIKRKYIGLQNDSNISLIAYYVYFYHARQRVTHTASVGEVSPKTENANRASSYSKQVFAWNSFVTRSGDVSDFWFDKLNLSTYQHFNDKGSLFNFLLANKEVYPEWEFESSEQVTMLGI